MHESTTRTRSIANFGWGVLVTVPLLAVVAACSTESPEPTTTFRPTATIRDIMLTMIDPSADVIWESVATIVSYDGVEDRRPRTDEEWERVRDDAIELVEATNLLLMEGRAVAAPGIRSENPGLELEPEEIQVLIEEDRATWNRMVGDLYTVSLIMLNAVNAKDADMLFDNGGPLDRACENCHQEYWYPDAIANPPIPANFPVTDSPGARAVPAETGTIHGHVRLSGHLPGNAVIRMGVDPGCGQLNAGKQVVQEAVAADRDGSLKNVFVQLQGTFPTVPLPDEPVVVDQQDCVFVPRVVGARVGQLVEFTNSDPLLHNVHSLSATTNSFNVGQPMEGMVHDVRLEKEDGMLRITCDRHRWMTQYVGVVTHPYFAVSDRGGTFSVEGVPAGTHTIQTWHEVYGTLTQTVRVEAGEVTMAEFTYPGVTE